MLTAYIDGVGVLAPGLLGWEQTAHVLSGRLPYAHTPLPRLNPARLAPDVRRRTSEHIRLAVLVATEAVDHSGVQPTELAAVFASSESDGAITHEICAEVAKPEPQVSPTRFHNSVNNAPAGYWSMATGSQYPSTSIAGFDASFASGLLESCAQLACGERAILFVAHDMPLPAPLNELRKMDLPFGAAFVLSSSPQARTLAKLELSLDSSTEHDTRLDDPALESLRLGNPAARGLPLLASLADKDDAAIVLPYHSGCRLTCRLSTVG